MKKMFWTKKHIAQKLDKISLTSKYINLPPIDTLDLIGQQWDRQAVLDESNIPFFTKYINPSPDWEQEPDLLRIAKMAMDINHMLRENKTNEDIENISHRLELTRIKKDIIVFRGVCEYVYEKMLIHAKQLNEQQHIQTDFYEKGFLSTSLLKGAEIPSYVHLRIYVPAGTQATYLGNINEELFYQEVVIQKGQLMKIESIGPKYINCRIIGTFKP